MNGDMHGHQPAGWQRRTPGLHIAALYTCYLLKFDKRGHALVLSRTACWSWPKYKVPDVEQGHHCADCHDDARRHNLASVHIPLIHSRCEHKRDDQAHRRGWLAKFSAVVRVQAELPEADQNGS